MDYGRRLMSLQQGSPIKSAPVNGKTEYGVIHPISSASPCCFLTNNFYMGPHFSDASIVHGQFFSIVKFH